MKTNCLCSSWSTGAVGMLRFTSLVALAGSAFLLVAMSGASSAQAGCSYNSPTPCAREKKCGTVPIVTEGVQARTKVFSRGYSCRKARRVIWHLNDGRYPGNWGCTGSGEGGYCYRSNSGRYIPWSRIKHRRHVRNSNVVSRSRPGISAGRPSPEMRARALPFVRRCGTRRGNFIKTTRGLSCRRGLGISARAARKALTGGACNVGSDPRICTFYTRFRQWNCSIVVGYGLRKVRCRSGPQRLFESA